MLDDLTRSLQDAGLPLCDRHDGGVRLTVESRTANPAQRRTLRVRIGWALSERQYLDLRRSRQTLHVAIAMNNALPHVLTALGWRVETDEDTGITVVKGRAEPGGDRGARV